MKLLFTNWRKAKKDQIEKGRYHGGQYGEYFRCAWCGKKFEENDEYNMVYTNDLESGLWKYIYGNPFVCKFCFNLYGEDLISELEDRAYELVGKDNENRYWWFLRRSK